MVFKFDGFYRFIFNFKSCNEVVFFRYFKMDILSIVINLIRLGVYMVFFDLKYVYYIIFIVVEYRKYLKFVWGG